MEQLKKARFLSLASAPIILVALAGAVDESPDGVASDSLLISFLPLAWFFLVSSSDLASAASLATGALRAATSSLVSRKCS